ncbi:Glycoside hydrolase, family 17 [Corchorus capsularis]|uniref:glucan endo-1,3-beta-D-glucosidase n=1 Tax=Corchorus capsularis TaxID=210143 RepID=A0A1R3IGR3_COCAP|nr:Glycoside hydrolase, family 17 [Corchorus capsularis]
MAMDSSNRRSNTRASMAAILLICGFLLSHLEITGAQSIGVCYGRNGDNLPSAAEVVSLYQSNGIGRMRIYDPNQETLNSLRGSNIELILDVPLDKLEELTNAAAANEWVQTNVVSFSPDVKFRYIAVGNEVSPSDQRANFVLPAMTNVHNALAAAGLQDQIKVSTAIASSLLGDSSPPSDGSFSDTSISFITPIINFLASNGSPLLANIYPYFSYTGDPINIGLDFALFNAPEVVVQDGEYGYKNLFDALVDSLYSALEKTGGANVNIVVSESGWPSEGGDAANVDNAGTYYRNLINHVTQGTPKRSGQAIETYLFAMFDENLKEAGVEQHFGAKPIGVCNGRIADNLPSEQEVVNFYTSNGIGKMRIYDPNTATLQALRGTNIELILGVPNQDLQSLATPSAANDWVQRNVVAFSDVKFRYISVGNEIKPGDAAAPFVLPAMQNINNALASANLGQIKVSTSIDTSLLGNSYPPSAGSFNENASPHITPIINFLATTGAPLLANVYTYFPYISDPVNINIGYALLASPAVVVQDGTFGYQNLFDAMLDALYSALEKAGGASVDIVVSESGWPSSGEASATVENASTYYKNLINHVVNGTPKKPGKPIETYLFALFDENQKGPAETERHFGLFYPTKEPKYGVSFT